MATTRAGAASTQWTAAAPAAVQQDTLAAVASAGVTLTGSPSSPSYSWTLEAPDGTVDTAATLATTTAQTHGGFTPVLVGGRGGVWLAHCTVTVGTDSVTVTQRIQIGDDEGMVLFDLSGGTTTDTAGLFDAATTWSTSSTVVVDETVFASQLSSAVRLVQIAASPPTDCRGFRMRIRVTAPGANSNGSNLSCRAILSRADPPALNTDAVVVGGAVKSSGTKKATKARFAGVNDALGATLSGRIVSEAVVAYSGSAWGAAVHSAAGATSGTEGGVDNLGVSGVASGAVYLGVSCAQQDSTPIAGPSTQTWSSVEVWGCFLTGAAA